MHTASGGLCNLTYLSPLPPDPSVFHYFRLEKALSIPLQFLHISDHQSSAAGHIGLALLYTPFLLLFMALLVLVGLAMAVTPASFVTSTASESGQMPCDHPVHFGLRATWPDQAVVNYVHEW